MLKLKIESKMYDFKDFFKKTYFRPRSQLIYLISFSFLSLLICWIARLYFPEPFSIKLFSISAQGDPRINPKGCRIFNIGIFILGFWQIPHIFYIFKHLRKFSPNLSKLSLILNIISVFNVSLVGIFPLNYELAHQIVATIAFSGYILSINIYTFILIMKIPYTFHHLNQIVIGLFTFVINFLYVIMIISWRMEENSSGNALLRVIWNFSLWEWFYFYGILCWFMLLSLIFYKCAQKFEVIT